MCCSISKICVDPRTGAKQCCSKPKVAVCTSSDGQCCPVRSGRPCFNKLTNGTVCCGAKAMCLGTEGICCPSNRLCRNWRDNNTFCCPEDTACTMDGICCPSSSTCRNPVTKAIACCPGQSGYGCNTDTGTCCLTNCEECLTNPSQCCLAPNFCKDTCCAPGLRCAGAGSGRHTGTCCPEAYCLRMVMVDDGGPIGWKAFCCLPEQSCLVGFCVYRNGSTFPPFINAG